MALEIKVLDFGDIELESSFLVLGRGCGRTRRVPVYGFLILGGQYPIVVDTGYRDNAIMETLGMRGLQHHENMIENQLARHGVKVGDVRYVCHTHAHIDHAGKDDHFPMTVTGIGFDNLSNNSCRAVSAFVTPPYAFDARAISILSAYSSSSLADINKPLASDHPSHFVLS